MCAFNEVAFRSAIVFCFTHSFYLPSIGKKEIVAQSKIQKKTISKHTKRKKKKNVHVLFCLQFFFVCLKSLPILVQLFQMIEIECYFFHLLLQFALSFQNQ